MPVSLLPSDPYLQDVKIALISCFTFLGCVHGLGLRGRSGSIPPGSATLIMSYIEKIKGQLHFVEIRLDLEPGCFWRVEFGSGFLLTAISSAGSGFYLKIGPGSRSGSTQSRLHNPVLPVSHCSGKEYVNKR